MEHDESDDSKLTNLDRSNHYRAVGGVRAARPRLNGGRPRVGAGLIFLADAMSFTVAMQAQLRR